MVLSDYLLLVNPTSGTRNKQRIVKEAVYRLSLGGHSVQIITTQYRGHGAELAREAVALGIPNVIAVGGDGTVNEIGGALAGSATALGIIPYGSGNGLARELHIPLYNKRQCIDVLCNGKTALIDYGTVNDHVFFCTVGSGFDSEVAAGFVGRKVRGLVPYTRLTIESFFKLQPNDYEAVIDGTPYHFHTIELNCACIKQFGYGAQIAPLANIQDGLLNLTVLPPLDFFKAQRCGLALFAKRLHLVPGVQSIAFRQMLLHLPKGVTFHIDGDAANVTDTLDIRCVPAGLKVLVP